MNSIVEIHNLQKAVEVQALTDLPPHLPLPPPHLPLLSSALTSSAARDVPSTNCDTRKVRLVELCRMKPHTRTKLWWSQAHNRGTISKLT